MLPSVPNGSTNSFINGLQEATYTVTITDGDGCTETIDYPLIEPDALTNNFINISNASCNGDNDGQVTADISGGTPGYSYSWSPSGGNNQTANSLSAGNYTVTVTDSRSCTESFDITITQPDEIIFGVEPNAFYGNDATGTISYNISCNGFSDGSVKANPDGGTPPYAYSWSPSGGNNQTANSLSANTYIVTVTDNRGCQEDFEITINEPDVIISGVEPNAFYGNNSEGDTSYHISCNGFSDGAAIVSLGGGTSPFSYSWTTGGSSHLENNMPAGTHSVTVTDDNGCLETMDVTLVEPDLLVVNGSSTGDYSTWPGAFDISCKGLNDGEAYADPFGGVPGTSGYMYSWTGPISQISNLDEIVNLYAGTYSITVTDANGCTDSQTFTLTEPTDYFEAVVILQNYAGAGVAPLTAGFQDATITMDPVQHTFFWSTSDSTVYGPNSMNQQFPDHNFIEIGANEVYIKIQNMNSGCIDDTTFIIEVQGIPEIHNVFTPNGDGTNDYFDFGEYAMKEVNIYLYNRWGELVFNWDTPETKWDGRGLDGEELPEGVYYYVLNAVGEDGYVYNKKGSITLLR